MKNKNAVPYDYLRDVRLSLAMTSNDFYNLLIQTEHHNLENNPDCFPWSYQYAFPRRNAYFYINLDEQGNCKFDLCVNGKTYSMGGSEKSPKELGVKSILFQHIMEDNHLSFCPVFTDEFKKEVCTADVGTVIILNTKRAISCIKKDNDLLYFKNCFSGSLENLTLQSFQSGEVFAVNLNNFDDIQDLFESAYNTRSLTANIRISVASTHGAYTVTEIENNLSENDYTRITVGPIQIKACKLNGNPVWYDNQNKLINRETVVNLFGWIALSLPDIQIERNDFPYFHNIVDDVFLIKNIQNLAKMQQFDEIANTAFDYAGKQSSPVYLKISGIQKKNDTNYELVSYAFYQNRIFKVPFTKIISTKQLVPDSIQEVTQNEFVKFCQERYRDEIQYLETEYSGAIDEYRNLHPSSISKEEMLNAVIKQHIEKSPPIISIEESEQIAKTVGMLVENEMRNMQNTKEEPDYD